MAEPEVLSEFSDNQINAASTQVAGTKLPKILLPHSRLQSSSRAQSRRTPPFLPPLKSNPADPSQNQQAGTGQGDRNDFALQIQERLKMVMQNVNHGEIEDNSQGQSQVQFEELVEQNKEKIKQQKQKVHVKPNNQIKEQRREGKSKSKVLKYGNKNDNSLYEKRMKEFRQASSENKYLLKKKELLMQRQEAIEKAVERNKAVKQQKEEITLRASKDTEDVKQANKQPSFPHNYNSASNKESKHQLPARFKSKGSSRNLMKDEENIPRHLQQQSKTANLFDNIHNLLQNPIKNRASSEIKKSNVNHIKVLEQKIKLINKKLGFNEDAQIKPIKNEIEQKTVSDWKRIDYNQGSDFKCFYDSNFEKEVDKINTLQQKNNDYLSQLVSHQKTLVQLALIKKIKPNLTTNIS